MIDGLVTDAVLVKYTSFGSPNQPIFRNIFQISSFGNEKALEFIHKSDLYANKCKKSSILMITSFLILSNVGRSKKTSNQLLFNKWFLHFEQNDLDRKIFRTESFGPKLNQKGSEEYASKKDPIQRFGFNILFHRCVAKNHAIPNQAKICIEM